MFDYRKNVEDIFFEESGTIFILEIIFSEENLNPSFHAESSEQGDLL